jgi:hypothetical protein
MAAMERGKLWLQGTDTNYGYKRQGKTLIEE